MRLVFAGTPDFAAASLEALLNSAHSLVGVYTQPDRPAGRGRRVRESPVKRMALEHEIPVYQPRTLRTPDAAGTLSALRPDLMVVAAYGLILPQAVLDVPSLGCVNVHASLLPRWRGAAPIQRAILAGDQVTGISIMQVDAGLDTGDVLATAEHTIGPTETGGTLHDRLAALGAETLLAVLDEVEAGRARPRPQGEAGACYADRVSKDEARIDWSRPARHIERQVRAFNPWPVTFTGCRGETLRVWEAQVLDGTGGQPGRVVAAGAQGIDVATRDGVLRLCVVQRPGGRPIPVRDYLNAHALRPGDSLGDDAG